MPTQNESAEGTQNVDPLISLGLIDPRMLDAEPGSNYQQSDGEGEAPAADEGKAKPTEVDTLTARVKELEAQVTQSHQQPLVSAIGGASFEQDVSRIDSLANQALAEAMQAPAVKEGKVDAGTIKALVTAEQGRLVAEARSFWDRAALQPAAQLAAAQKMAKELSTATVTLTADDLKGERTYDAMRARATALLDERRGANYQARQKRGADRVEGGANPGSVDSKTIDGLDAFNKIKLGLLRAR